MISRILSFFRNLFLDAVPDEQGVSEATLDPQPERPLQSEESENIFDGLNGDTFLSELKSIQTNSINRISTKDEIKTELKNIAKKHTGIG